MSSGSGEAPPALLRVFFVVQNGFVHRAMAKLAQNGAVSDVENLNGRLVACAVRAQAPSDIARVVEFDVLKQTSFFVRVYVALVHLPPPSPIMALAAARARGDLGKRRLELQPGDVDFLLPHSAVLRDALAAWRAARPPRSPCQTFEVQLHQIGGNDVRQWIAVPLVDEFARQFACRAEYADSLGALLYRAATRGAHADVILSIYCSEHFTALLIPITADFQPKPGINHHRWKGLDARTPVGDGGDGSDGGDGGGDGASAADTSTKRSAKKARVDDDGDAANVEDGDENSEGSDDGNHTVWNMQEPPMRLQRAETILQARTSSLIVVVDRAFDWHNINAILRSCDALGVQNVWVITPLEGYKGVDDATVDINRRINRGTDKWLTVRVFESRSECIAALRAEPGNLKIWACDVNDKAMRLDLPPSGRIAMPERLALVMGHERTGVSEQMLSAADAHVYLPIFGFGSSLNLSVATALIMQRVFDLAPHYRGQMPAAERAAIRMQWFVRLAVSDQQRVVAEAWASRAEPLPLLADLRRRVIRSRPSVKLEQRLQETSTQLEARGTK